VKAGALSRGGIAWDGGHGIRTVEISTDGSKTWVLQRSGTSAASLPHFQRALLAKEQGKHIVMARATNKMGQSQTSELIPNPAGYHHSLRHSIALTVT
jgi:hypothetical protein